MSDKKYLSILGVAAALLLSAIIFGNVYPILPATALCLYLIWFGKAP